MFEWVRKMTRIETNSNYVASLMNFNICDLKFTLNFTPSKNLEYWLVSTHIFKPYYSLAVLASCFCCYSRELA